METQPSMNLIPAFTECHHENTYLLLSISTNCCQLSPIGHCHGNSICNQYRGTPKSDHSLPSLHMVSADNSMPIYMCKQISHGLPPAPKPWQDHIGLIIDLCTPSARMLKDTFPDSNIHSELLFHPKLTSHVHGTWLSMLTITANYGKCISNRGIYNTLTRPASIKYFMFQTNMSNAFSQSLNYMYLHYYPSFM